MEFEPRTVVDATVKFRRGPGWKVKPEFEWLDDQRVRLMAGFVMEKDGEHSCYIGEQTFDVDWRHMDQFPPEKHGDTPLYFARGDLVNIEQVPS